MRLYRPVLIWLGCVSIINATTLKEIINSTLENNINIKAISIENKAQQKAFEGVENIYNPTATVGANYSQLDLDMREVQVGNTGTAFLKLGMNLYDGGKNQAIKDQKNFEYQAGVYDSDTAKKELILQVVTLFYQIKTVGDTIKVFQDKGRTLRAQYERVQTEYTIKMITIDEVLKLQSEYETNQYTIAELKYQESSLIRNISLLANQKINKFDYSTLPDVKNLRLQESTEIEALKMSILAKGEAIKIASSVNKPQVKLENSLNLYGYSDYNNNILTDLPTTQNQLMVSLTYNLYDTTSKKRIEVAQLEKLASEERLHFRREEEKMNFDLAKQKLNTQLLKLNSLKSAVQMGKSVYEIITIKYQNGIVDNITYLDALSKKIFNEALYKQALNNYEIAKANYYFNSGVDYKSVLKKW
jgi:outer membrane protein TolC